MQRIFSSIPSLGSYIKQSIKVFLILLTYQYQHVANFLNQASWRAQSAASAPLEIIFCKQATAIALFQLAWLSNSSFKIIFLPLHWKKSWKLASCKELLSNSMMLVIYCKYSIANDQSLSCALLQTLSYN